MKIAIVGTHSVGKTTLAQDIQKHLGIPLIRSDKARTLGKPKRLDLHTSDEQKNLQDLMSSTMCELQESTGPFVLDCSSLTCPAYASELISEEFMDNGWLWDLHEKCVNNAFENLDYILYVPEELPLELDGFRPPSEELRTRIDSRIRKILGISYGKVPHHKVRLICGSREERLYQVCTLLGKESEFPFKNLYSFEGIPKSGKTTQINILKKNPLIHLCPRLGLTDEQKKNLKDLYSEPEKNSELLLESHKNAFKNSIEDYKTLERLKEESIVILDRSRWTVIALHLAIQGWHRFSHIFKQTRDIPFGNVVYFKGNTNNICDRSRDDDHPIKSNKSLQKQVGDNYNKLLNILPTSIVIDAESPIENINRNLNKLLVPQNCLKDLQYLGNLRRNLYLKTGTPEWGSSEYAQDLAFQVGNINSLLLKLKGKSYSNLSKDELKSGLGAELVDIIYETLQIAELEGIDLNKSWEDKRFFDVNKIKNRM